MKENRTKEKKVDESYKLLGKLSKCLKKWFKNMTLEHPFGVTVGVSVGLFLFAFVFRWSLNVLREVLYIVRGFMGEEFLPSVRTNQGVDTWFAFFGSYFGMIATVALGIITLRFSFRLGQREQLAKVRGIKIKQMRLYDMFSDFAPSQWKHGETRKYRFLLKIVLTKYDPIYNFEIEEILWGNCNKEYGYGDKRELSNYKAYVDNAGKTTIYVYFTEFESNLSGGTLKDTISYFYHIREYEPLLLERHERSRRIEIYMKLTDIAYFKNQDPDVFWVKFSIVFENNKKLEKCVELHEIIHNVEISNAPYDNK